MLANNDLGQSIWLETNARMKACGSLNERNYLILAVLLIEMIARLVTVLKYVVRIRDYAKICGLKGALQILRR